MNAVFNMIRASRLVGQYNASECIPISGLTGETLYDVVAPTGEMGYSGLPGTPGRPGNLGIKGKSHQINLLLAFLLLLLSDSRTQELLSHS